MRNEKQNYLKSKIAEKTLCNFKNAVREKPFILS